MSRAMLALLLASLLVLSSCAAYKLPKSLDPDSREFLSKVRYIIDKPGRQAFLSLAGEAERKAFIEDFWRKRDPDPETEVNEFKMEYFKRIDEANLLFKEGTTAGWLQDRGRLYITLGPPDNRETYPRGVTFYGKPTEIWYYGFFPVVFVDDNWSGTYRLQTLNVAHLSEIARAQELRKPLVRTDEWLPDFPLEIQKIKDGEAVIRVKLPYKDIWFKAEENVFQATLKLTAEAFDAAKQKVWEGQKSFPLSFSSEEYLKIIRETFIIEIPVQLDPGSYDLRLVLKNITVGTSAEKKEKLNL